ncbi:hypothetical protein [Sporosarcina sp. NCCP-2716]|uniref:hypothetical protein n=1 Tax=Sporosarcina sp. NCCP-2716 TaxID=2943679 RepID=UPI00203D595D|nr:hypothetical protein [Sporosarcina sp. NCCP-2716]
MKKVISFCFLLFLVACQPVQTNDSSHITEEEVIMALQDNEIVLVKTEFPKNPYGQKLGNVKPGTYEVNTKKQLCIFEFKNDNDLKKGKIEFANRIEKMELNTVSVFEKRNILIIYVHQQNEISGSAPVEKEIQKALDGIIEG